MNLEFIPVPTHSIFRTVVVVVVVAVLCYYVQIQYKFFTAFGLKIRVYSVPSKTLAKSGSFHKETAVKSPS